MAIALLKLVEGIPSHLLVNTGIPDPSISVSGIVYDSRQVQPGSLFVALEGGNVDGHRFIPDAIQRGASAIVGTQPINTRNISYIQVIDSRLGLAYLSAAYYRYPARSLVVIGVTGTDGKTTTASLIHQILARSGFRAGLITTVSAVIGDEILDTGFHVTTPESPDIQRYLAQMVSSGLTHVVLEATSHGLAQHRVAACEFDIGVVTNITHEHLDYHGSYEAYREAKARLFRYLSETASKPAGIKPGAALNRDDQSYDYLSHLTSVHQVSYGIRSPADVRVKDLDLMSYGSHFDIVSRDKQGKTYQVEINSSLVGEYNVSNCLAAFVVTHELLDVQPDQAAEAIARFSGVPGRMERIDLGQDFSAIVDFAHTPNALQRVLEAARDMTQGRVIAVFGSAGLRDRAKRRMMAEISTEYADLTVLTAEDPRTESLELILSEMAMGAEAKGGVEGRTFWRVTDRGEAIRFGISLARLGDLIIVCGKGHEQSMCFGETEYPWDDRIALRAALSEHLNIPGPRMPHLPTQDH